MGKSPKNLEPTLGRRGTEAVVNVPDEGTGKPRRVRLGIPFDDTERRDAAFKEFVNRHRAVVEVQRQLTLQQCWDLWLADRKKDKLSNTIYEHNWKPMREPLGSIKAMQLVRDDSRDYAQARFDKGIKPWTVHTELSRLRACLKWCFEEGLISKRPKVWVPKPGKSRQRVLTFDEAKKLIGGAEKCQWHVYLFVVLLFATGARHKAVLDLTWKRVDFKKNLIIYDEDLPPDPMSKAWRKGRATVPMNALARTALERAAKHRRSRWVVEHNGRIKECGDGFRSAVVNAGLWDPNNHITPHTIRHTVLTWLDEADVTDKRRAQLAGHKNERTTNEVYTHTKPDVLLDAVKTLELPFAPLPAIDHSEVKNEADDSPETVDRLPMGENDSI